MSWTCENYYQLKATDESGMRKDILTAMYKKLSI